MASIVGGFVWNALVFCYDRHEEIIRYIRMRNMHYHPVVMRVFCLPLKFLAGFVIPDAVQYNLMFNTLHKICILISLP